MTTNLFLPTGTELKLPSGRYGTLVRWVTRHIDPGNRDAGMERLAMVRLEGDHGMHTAFAEAFVRRCEVLP